MCKPADGAVVDTPRLYIFPVASVAYTACLGQEEVLQYIILKLHLLISLCYVAYSPSSTLPLVDQSR